MKPRSRRKLLLFLVCVAPALPSSVIGHSTGLSTADLKFTTNGLEAELTLAAADLTAALAHLETLHPLDANHDGQVSRDEFTASLEHLKTLATGALVVGREGTVPATTGSVGLDPHALSVTRAQLATSPCQVVNQSIMASG